MLEMFTTLAGLATAIFTAIGVGLTRSDPSWRDAGVWRILAVGGGIAITFCFPAAVGAGRHFGPGIFVVVAIHAWVGIAALACLLDAVRGVVNRKDARSGATRRLLLDAVGALGLPLLLWVLRKALTW